MSYCDLSQEQTVFVLALKSYASLGFYLTYASNFVDTQTDRRTDRECDICNMLPLSYLKTSLADKQIH